MVKDIRKNAKIVDSFLKQYFKKQKNSNLISPMKYGILSGGKKIRSNIIITQCVWIEEINCLFGIIPYFDSFRNDI